MIDTIRYDIVERYPNDFVLATSAAQIEAAHKQGKIAALIGIEGGHAIQDNLANLQKFYGRGVRYMTLTHTNTNDWADSAGMRSTLKPRHHGLSPFGEEVVKEMQRIGMLVDVAHVSDETIDDVLRVAKAPIVGPCVPPASA